MTSTSWKLNTAEVFEVTATTPGEGLRALATILDGKGSEGKPIMPLSISTFLDLDAVEPYQFTVTMES